MCERMCLNHYCKYLLKLQRTLHSSRWRRWHLEQVGSAQTLHICVIYRRRMCGMCVYSVYGVYGVYGV
jgi:hypothetical protein